MKPESTTTYPPADLTRRVADIIDFTPELFKMDDWGETDCETPACIAGHIARLHIMEETGLVDSYYLAALHKCTKTEWIARQGERINLTYDAALNLFEKLDLTGFQAVRILRLLTKENEEIEAKKIPHQISSEVLDNIMKRAISESD